MLYGSLGESYWLYNGRNTIYTIDELLAMILENAKNIAESYSGERVYNVIIDPWIYRGIFPLYRSEMPMKGGIIVIPPYFNQEERLAILGAAKIAGINILQLMNSNTAVALNYGIFRRKSFNSTAQYYMFYDVGSSSTIVSIAGVFSCWCPCGVGINGDRSRGDRVPGREDEGVRHDGRESAGVDCRIRVSALIY